jgi:opacity protein-like surface antigen
MTHFRSILGAAATAGAAALLVGPTASAQTQTFDEYVRAAGTGPAPVFLAVAPRLVGEDPAPRRAAPADEFAPGFEPVRRTQARPASRDPLEGFPPARGARAPASAGPFVYDREHFLIRGGGAIGIVGFTSDYESSGVDTALEGGDLVYSFEGALGFETPLGLGADWQQSVRVELMYRYLQALDDDELFGDGTYHDGLINVSLHARRDRIRPFIGAGVGLSVLEQGDDLGANFDDGIGLAFQGFAGVGFEITPNLDLEVRGDYTYRFITVEQDGTGTDLSADLDTLSASVSLVLRI